MRELTRGTQGGVGNVCGGTSAEYPERGSGGVARELTRGTKIPKRRRGNLRVGTSAERLERAEGWRDT